MNFTNNFNCFCSAALPFFILLLLPALFIVRVFGMDTRTQSYTVQKSCSKFWEMAFSVKIFILAKQG